MIHKLFAWWPIKVTSGKRVWFKHYYRHRMRFDPSTGMPPISAQYFEYTETAKERTWRLLTDRVEHNRNIWNDPYLTKQDKQ